MNMKHTKCPHCGSEDEFEFEVDIIGEIKYRYMFHSGAITKEDVNITDDWAYPRQEAKIRCCDCHKDVCTYGEMFGVQP